MIIKKIDETNEKVGDLIIDEKYRRLKVGSKLVKAVEEANFTVKVGN